jgi:hypothetical protein
VRLRATVLSLIYMKNVPDHDAVEIKRLLRRAAEIATSHSSRSQEFVLAAFHEFLECNPRMRDRLEREQMAEEFAAARRQGKLASA